DVFRVVTASRIEKDKTHQWRSVTHVINSISKKNIERIEVKVLGDGSNRGEVEALLRSEQRTDLPISIEFLGWVDTETVVEELSQATISVGAGRSALQSLAVGTPVYAAGRSATIGLATARNLDLAVWSSFG